MSEREMTLSLRIRANMAEGRKAIESFTRTFETMRGTAAGTLNALGGALRVATAPLRLFGGAALAVGTATVGLGTAAIVAASQYESLQLRLESVMGSSRAAAAAFKETIAFANSTPFEAGDLIDARIMLEGIGIRGVPALKATAQAAAAMGVGVRDAAAMVASMETEPLRRLGISVKRDGESAVFNFRDKMGRMRVIATETSEAARMSLLGIFNTKFGGATDRLGGSMSGMLSTLKDGMTAIFANVGKGLMPGAKQFVGFLNDEIGRLVDSGALEKFGSKVGAKLKTAVEFAIGGMQEMPNLIAQIRGIGAGIGPVLKAAAGATGTVMINAIVESWKASSGIFVGLGKVLAGAFLEDILQMPFMSGTRGKMADAALGNMGEEDLRAFIRANGLEAQLPSGALTRGAATADTLRTGVAGMNLSAAQQASLAGFGRDKLFQAGIDQAMGAIPGAMSRLSALASSEFGAVDRTLQGATGGYSFADSVRGRVANMNREDLYTVRGPGRDRGYINGQWMGSDPGAMSSFRGPVGSHRAGEYTGRGVIINVQTLQVQANDVRWLQDQLIKKYSPSSLGMAPSGT